MGMLNFIWEKFGQKKCRERRPRRSAPAYKFHQTLGRSCLIEKREQRFAVPLC